MTYSWLKGIDESYVSQLAYYLLQAFSRED